MESAFVRVPQFVSIIDGCFGRAFNAGSQHRRLDEYRKLSAGRSSVAYEERKMRFKPFAALLALTMTGATLPAINLQRMSEVSRTLASDEFQGRAPGTIGEELTIPFLIDQFKAAGLEPAGENGGWTQEVPMIRTQVRAPVNISVEQAGQRVPLHFPDDIYVGTVRAVDHVRIAAAPMVFVGYGVSAPERHWDDFKGMDLRGKVAVILVNDPD